MKTFLSNLRTLVHCLRDLNRLRSFLIRYENPLCGGGVAILTVCSVWQGSHTLLGPYWGPVVLIAIGWTVLSVLWGLVVGVQAAREENASWATRTTTPLTRDELACLERMMGAEVEGI